MARCGISRSEKVVLKEVLEILFIPCLPWNKCSRIMRGCGLDMKVRRPASATGLATLSNVSPQPFPHGKSVLATENDSGWDNH
jgi:hypothetical protein